MTEPVPVRIIGADKRKKWSNDKTDRTLHVSIFVGPYFEDDDPSDGRYFVIIVKNEARRSWVWPRRFETLEQIAEQITGDKQGARQITVSINPGYEEDLKAALKARRWKNVSITSERASLAIFPDL